MLLTAGEGARRSINFETFVAGERARREFDSGFEFLRYLVNRGYAPVPQAPGPRQGVRLRVVRVVDEVTLLYTTSET